MTRLTCLKVGIYARGLTGGEVKTWLEVARREETQADLITLGLWTGARLDELCSLETADVTMESDVAWLSIRTGKTQAATREIPVVDPEAIKVLQRRVAANGPRLFPELSPAGPDGKLSWNVQKRLGTSRWKALGKATPVDYHSLRRTYLTCAERAGTDIVAQARLVGHEAPTMAASIYSGGAGKKRLLKLQRSIAKEIASELAG